MSLVYAVKLISDLTFLYAALGLLGALYYTTGILAAVPPLLGLGAGLGYFFMEKGGRGWTRYAPLALALPLLLAPHETADLVLSLPALVYSLMYVKNNRRATDYYYAFQRFRVGAMLLPLLALLASVNGAWAWVDAIPFLLTHLALSVALFRMLRHEDGTIRERKFQLVNLGGVLGVCGAAVLLATPPALSAMRAAGLFLLNNALLPVLRGLAWVLTRIARGLSFLIGLIPWLKTEATMPEMGASQGDEQAMEIMPALEEAAANPALRAALIALGAALLALVVFLVLRALSKQMARMEAGPRRETREKLDAPGGLPGRRGSPFLRRNDPAQGIRAIYRRFMNLAAARGVTVRPNVNSRQIRDAARQAGLAPAPLDALRDAYLRARYRPSGPDAGDLDRAKEAWAGIKKSP